MSDKVTVEEVMAMMQHVADAIREGNTTSVSIKFMVDGVEHAHTFSLRTQEERDEALAGILGLLGQLH